MANTMKWGLMSSALYFIWFCLEYLTGLQSRFIAYQTVSSNLIAIPTAVFIVKGMLERKQQSGGRISYRRSLAAGTSISLVTAALSPLVLWIFTTWVNPDFFPSLVRHSVSIGVYADDAEAATRLNLQQYIIMGTLELPALGLITSSVAGLLIRTRT